MKVLFILSLFPLTAFGLARQSHSTLFYSSNTELSKSVYPWGKETVENTKAFFENYKHILLVEVNKNEWDVKQKPKLSVHHCLGKVVKVYKGDWKQEQNISFATYSDTDSPSKSEEPFRVIVFTNESKQKEITLDTGEMIPFRQDLEPALVYFYPSKNH